VRARISGYALVVVACATVACASALAASPASGAFIYDRGVPGQNDLVYAGTSGFGEQSDVLVQRIGTGTYDFVERGPTTITDFPSDLPCARVSPTEVTCPTNDGSGNPLNVDAELHDGNDSIDMKTFRPARIEGGLGADVLKGSAVDDVIIGNGDFVAGSDGNDTIDGRGGADHMLGGDGTDTVTYAGRTPAVNVSLDGAANDGVSGEGDNVANDVEAVDGGRGADTLTGNGSANILRGGEGIDDISGMGGVDELRGGDSMDFIDGGAGNDLVFGDNGSDSLRGGADTDQMDGGANDDGLIGGAGADAMGGGDGTDSVDYSAATVPQTVTVGDGLANDGASGENDNVMPDIEVVVGGQADDQLSRSGSNSPGELWGQGGNDTLIGGNSEDRLEGENGNDLLDGSYGADVINGDAGVDTVDYSTHSYTDVGTGDAFGVSSTPDGSADDGNDQIDRDSNGAPGFDNVAADVENVIGSDGPDFLDGTVDSNQLLGRGGGDTLHGEAGSDSLDGRAGADTMDGGADVDTVTYAVRSAGVRVSLDNAANDGDAGGEGDNVLDTVENVRGGAGVDVLIGSSAVNRLTGGPDDDILNGKLGADILDGQAGDDTVTYNDRIASVAVTLDGRRNDGADPNGNGTSTAAEEGDLDVSIESAIGGAADDTLRAPVADATANVLRGLGGSDTLNSREGTAAVDTLNCGPGTDRFAKDPSDVQAGCETLLP
jgi:Ca2+-binding RTX toxin-like protein